MKRSSWSYRTRIVALVVVTALPLSLLAMVGLWGHVQSAQGGILEDRVALAQASALSVDAFVNDMLASGQTLALDEAITDAHRQVQLQAFLRGVVDANPDWRQVALVGADGQLIAAAGTPPASGSSEERAAVRIPVTFSNGQVGALRIVPALDHLTNELRAQVHGTSGEIAVIDNAGEVFIPPASMASDVDVLGGHVVVDAVRSGQAGYTVDHMTNSDLLVAYAPVASSGWGVVVTESAQSAFGPVRNEAMAAILALVACVATAGAIAWVLGGRLVRAYDEAIAARKLAEEATRTRDSVMAMVSHDLRSPLTAIQGQAHLQRAILERDRGEINRSRLSLGVTRIEQAAQRMNHLLGELVDAARLEAGHTLDLRRRPADLVSLVAGIVDEQAQTTTRQRLVFRPEVSHLAADVDVPRIERVVANIISNAVKYSPAGGDIEVRLAYRDGRAHIEIQDHGVGIPEQDLAHVFERYHRAANVSGRIGGTGLGLAGARQLIEQNGGNISVDSREGIGSTFTLELPLAPQPEVMSLQRLCNGRTRSSTASAERSTIAAGR